MRGRCRSLLPGHNCTDMQRELITRLMQCYSQRRKQHCNNRVTLSRLKHDTLKGFTSSTIENWAYQ